jgi:hypothetical protein
MLCICCTFLLIWLILYMARRVYWPSLLNPPPSRLSKIPPRVPPRSSGEFAKESPRAGTWFLKVIRTPPTSASSALTRSPCEISKTMSDDVFQLTSPGMLSRLAGCSLKADCSSSTMGMTWAALGSQLTQECALMNTHISSGDPVTSAGESPPMRLSKSANESLRSVT